MPEAEQKCTRCPKCNCFSGMVHVPTTGEFFVSNGKVSSIEESEWTDSDEECEGYQIWVKRDDV